MFFAFFLVTFSRVFIGKPFCLHETEFEPFVRCFAILFDIKRVDMRGHRENIARVYTI